MNNPYRKTYLINRVFQIRFILEIVAVVLASTVLASAAFYLLADRELSSTFFSVHREVQSVRTVLIPAVALAAIVTFAVVAALCVYITVRETHRLAGPLYRFEQSIRQMAQGRVSTVTNLRKGDELRGLAEALNGLSLSLVSGSDRTREAVAGLRAVVGELSQKGALPPEAARLLEARIAEVESASGFLRP